MPAESEKQRRAAGMAYAAKKGEVPVSKMYGSAKQMYRSMTAEQLRHFAMKRKKRGFMSKDEMK